LLRPGQESYVAKKTRSTSKRELIDTGRTKMFGKRTAKGRFKEMDETSRSLPADRRKKAKKKTASGYGDQGDRGKKTVRKAGARKRTTKRSG